MVRSHCVSDPSFHVLTGGDWPYTMPDPKAVMHGPFDFSASSWVIQWRLKISARTGENAVMLTFQPTVQTTSQSPYVMLWGIGRMSVNFILSQDDALFFEHRPDTSYHTYQIKYTKDPMKFQVIVDDSVVADVRSAATLGLVDAIIAGRYIVSDQYHIHGTWDYTFVKIDGVCIASYGIPQCQPGVYMQRSLDSYRALDYM